MATQASICACDSGGELAVVHGDVALAPVPSRRRAARRAPAASICASTSWHLGEVVHARVVVLLVELVQPAPVVAAQGHGAVLGDDGLHRPGRAQTARSSPTGRPVMGTTFRPAALQAGRWRPPRARAPPLGGQRVIDVGSTRPADCAGTGSSDKGRRNSWLTANSQNKPVPGTG